MIVTMLAVLAGAAGGDAHAQTLPLPWASADIGNPPAVGSASESGGRFTIQGSGADIWGTSDQFHFLYQQVTGDVDVIARIDSITNVHAWSKAGVMIRSSLSPSAAHAFSLVSAAKGTAFQRRTSAGGLTSHTSGPAVTAPRWTRLLRRGSSVTAYTSADGTTWTAIASSTMALGATVYVGIAATSHTSALTTATASSVAVYPLALPAPYQSMSIGGATPAGSGSYRNGTFVVSGAGADVWGISDQFQFVYRQVTGDVDVRARVESLQYVQSWTKAGVMIRESLTADSPHAFALVSAGKGYAFQRRTDAGGLSTSTGGGAGAAPGWVRVVRTGTTIEAYRSSDGVNWTLIGSDTVSMAASVYVGMAVTSHLNGRLAEARFDNVAVDVEGGTTNAPPVVTLTAPAAGASYTAPATITVSATASDSDGEIGRVDFLANNSVIGTDATAPYSISWGSVQAGTYSVTAVAYDRAGASTASAAVAVTVNGAANQPPTIALTSPAAGASYTAPATIAVAATASDADGTVTRVEFFSNATLLSTDTTAPYSFSWTNVAAGSYAITAVAYDNAGATRSTSPVNVTVSAAANRPPTVALTSPTNGATFAAPATISIAANAADGDGSVSRVDFLVNGSLIGSDTAAPYSISWSNVAAGSYAVTARAFDSAGASTTSAPVSISVTATAPSQWIVAFTASPDHAGITRYVAEVFPAGADPATANPVATSDLGKPVPDAANEIRVDRTAFFAALAAGNYILTVRAENSGGFSRSTAFSFTR